MKSQNPCAQRFVVGTGAADKFDVIAADRKLNEEPLSLADAYRLAESSAAAVPVPKPKPLLGDDHDRRRSREMT
jgi:hypothetical protein